MAIDLRRPVTLPTKNGVKTGTMKKGINLCKRESRRNDILTLAVGIPLIVVVALAVAKFGVLDQIARLDQAQSDYERTHAQYLAASEAASRYDQVLLEYRTYSMEWMEQDKTGKFVSVERLKILKMVEQVVSPRGEIQNLSIRDDMLTMSMSGMNLKQITEMFNELEEYPFVSDCVLKTARSRDFESSNMDDWLAWDLSEEPVTFNVNIYLTAEGGGQE